MKLKHIIIIGVTVALAEDVWQRLTQKPTPGDGADKPLVAFAREAGVTTLGSPVVVTVTNWQFQVGQVLGSGSSAADQGSSLLAMLPQTPPEGQADVAEHASRLLSNASFASFGSQMTNTTTPSAIRRIVYAELLSRPNSVKLPWLIEVARSSVDNQSGEALLMLKSILREDYGSDWNAWHNRITVWMMENPS